MMPFSKAFDGTYAAIQEVCKLTKLRCERADNIWESSEIMQDIFSLIYQSQYVICDFTGANPNVFYETGIAHTLGRIVIPIAQNFDHVSFDLRHHRFIKYLDNGEGLAALSKALAKHLDTLRRLSSPAATNTSA